MFFVKYSSIGRTDNLEFMGKLSNEGHTSESVLWSVTEKCHGTNISYLTNGKQLELYNRKVLIADNFHKHLNRLDYIKPKIKNILSKLQSEDHTIKFIQVYGEYIGGSYSHSDVPKIPGMEKVKKGIQYSPDVLFYAFDIRINGESFINLDKARELFKSEGLLHSIEIHRGTLASCLEINPKFLTKVPAILGLPQIENNFGEGVVISLLNPKERNGGTCPNTGKPQRGERVILKSKHGKWLEKPKVRKKSKKIDTLNDNDNQFLNDLLQYLNEARLKNVLSNHEVSTVAPSSFGKIQRELSDDIIKDYLSEGNQEPSQIVARSLFKKCGELIRKFWGDIIKGDYQ